MTSRPALIVGGYGQVGDRLRALLAGRFVATSSRSRDAAATPFDLGELRSNPQVAKRLLASADFSSVYCVGGMTDVEGCESARERAMAINCEGPGILAAACAAHAVPFVYFSTDYVFDGAGGPYAEGDLPNPICVYGESKLAGERAVLQAHPTALIVRTTVVYGPDAGRKNFAYTLARLLSMGQTIRTPDDQISTPTYNDDLAAATVALVELGARGIVHVAGPEAISRTTFARRAAAALGLDAAGIAPVRTSELNQKARRPLQAGLRIDVLRTLLPDMPMRTVEAAIQHWRATSGELPA